MDLTGHPVGPDHPTSSPCSVSWAGPVALPLADETAVQAACGVMAVHGRRTGGPTPLGIDYCTVTARLLAEQATLGIRVAQARGIAIRSATTSVAEAALLSVAQYLAAATAPDDWPEPLLPGGPPFTAADGVQFEIETFDAERWHRFWSLLDADEAAVRSGWRPFQQRFATATCPLPDALHVAARQPFEVLRDAAGVAGVSLLPLREPGRSPLPAWRTHPLGGTAARRLTGSGRLPLAGLVVVEAGRRVQGPLAGHLLGLLGARVIRVEPAGGDPLRWVPPMVGDCSARFLALNHGKAVTEVDLRTDAGRATVRELVVDADVFLHNWAPGKASSLALDAEHLARVRPGLVYAWASGWGDALGADPPIGTDFLVQAHSGLAVLGGSLMTLTDVFGGVLAATAVLAGLLQRIHSRQGQRVDSSLLSGAQLLVRTGRPPTALKDGALVHTDLAGLATDPAFAGALRTDGYTQVRAPWQFAA